MLSQGRANADRVHSDVAGTIHARLHSTPAGESFSRSSLLSRVRVVTIGRVYSRRRVAELGLLRGSKLKDRDQSVLESGSSFKSALAIEYGAVEKAANFAGSGSARFSSFIRAAYGAGEVKSPAGSLLTSVIVGLASQS